MLVVVNYSKISEATAIQVGHSTMLVIAKASKAKDINESSFRGLNGSLNWFATEKIAFQGQFTLQFSPSELSSLALGGTGGMSYYLIGGKPFEIITDRFKLQASPRWSLYAFGGFSQWMYDFTTVVAATQSASTGLRKTVSRVGQFYGVATKIGLEYPSDYLLNSSVSFLSANYVQSLPVEDAYQVTLIYITAGMGIAF